MKKNEFNSVAPYYDRLARFVFGDELLKAQEFFLNEISKKDRLLIVGGGSGEILKHSALQQAKVDYVELSEVMLKQAKAQPVEKASMQFYAKDIRDHEGQYDWLICNFFLDCFQEESLQKLLPKLKSLLTPRGQMMVTDFSLTSRPQHKALLYLMVTFFRLTANLEASKLLDIDAQVQQHFYLKEKKCFNKGLIFSARYSAIEQSI